MALPQPTTRQQPPVMTQKLRNPPDSATAYNLLFNNMQLFQNGTQHNHYSPQTLSLHHLQEQQRQLQQQQKQKKRRKAKHHPATTVESSSGWSSVPLSCWISLLIYISIRLLFTDNRGAEMYSLNRGIRNFLASTATSGAPPATMCLPTWSQSIQE